jgi:hypothetical protein
MGTFHSRLRAVGIRQPSGFNADRLHRDQPAAGRAGFDTGRRHEPIGRIATPFDISRPIDGPSADSEGLPPHVRGTRERLTIRLLIVALTLATAAIHASLGGALFTSNAIGYTALAVAMILPGPIRRFRWLVRLALIGFTALTIGGWFLSGPRFQLGYVDKGIEVALITLVTLDLWRESDRGHVARQARQLMARVARSATFRGEVPR